jgi:hypothetical protein
MITLAHDWIGPQGPWPNGQNLDLLVSPDTYERSYYSVSNKHAYNLESYRHQFTYSKIESIIGSKYIRKPINECNGKFIYELTPLLKPYQWVDNAFDNVSDTAIQKQKEGKCLIVINDLFEGYSNKDYNFFENLHKQIDKVGLIHKNVMYITMNSVLDKEYNLWCNKNNVTNRIKIHSLYVFERLYNKDKITQPSKHYICLNRQPNPYRQCLVYELWRRDLLKYGYVSMPDPSILQDVKFNKDNLKLFNLDDSRWDEFLESLPYEVDGRDFTAQTCKFNTISDFYKDSVYAIVTENVFGDTDCIKFSEKTFNAFDNYCIPLHFYSTGMANELKNIGYNIDTSVDNISNKQEKFFALVEKIADICNTPIEELHRSTAAVRKTNYKNLQKRYKTQYSQHLEIFKEWHEY